MLSPRPRIFSRYYYLSFNLFCKVNNNFVVFKLCAKRTRAKTGENLAFLNFQGFAVRLTQCGRFSLGNFPES